MPKKLLVATIFLGSFLLFGVQPMVGRTLLPVFGGTAAVWVVCLCAFQVFLLGGYWYADWLAGRGRSPKLGWHVTLLLMAAAWVVTIGLRREAIIAAIGGGTTGDVPALDVLACVFCLVGVPYMLQTST